MVRRHRSKTINIYDLGEIERQASLLESKLRAGQLSLQPTSPHYDAAQELCVALRTALNLLNDRPADWIEPHQAPFSNMPPAWPPKNADKS